MRSDIARVNAMAAEDALKSHCKKLQVCVCGLCERVRDRESMCLCVRVCACVCMPAYVYT